MTVLDHQLDRTIVIRAPREIVFRYFTDPARWAAWWGAGSDIDARAGGAVRIRYPDGSEAVGEVVDIAPPDQIVFTYGYASGTPVPPGGSRVTIALEPHAEGTRLHLTHAFTEAEARDLHVQGWRYQLSVFSNVVSSELCANAAAVIDAWFDAWTMPDPRQRETALAGIASPTVQFRDRYSAIDGLEELRAHISGTQRFMPGVRLQRRGDVRQCQGIVLADWAATRGDGQTLGTGTNVFTFGADAKLASIVGVWN